MIVDNALYRDGVRVELDCGTGDLKAVREQADGDNDFVWVGLHKPTEEELSQIEEVYGIHPLALEDAFMAHQRPKLERYDDTLFLVLKTLWYVDEFDAVETGEINLFVGHNFVISVRHGEGNALHHARMELEKMESVLKHGPSAVVYAICDQVVDRYEEVGADLTEDVDEVEASVFSEERTNDSRRIYLLKRELAEMRRAVLPLKDPMLRFANQSVRGIAPEAATYFRDVADHLARVAETIDTLDNLLSTAFDAHIAQLSLQQNDDMRRISAAVGLVAAPTLVAGIYGMNFDHMPELHWLLGYPFALLLMMLSSLTVYLVSKRAGWL
ncbi:magnesium and cobalt transport protein CorA [Nocardioides mangrovicus]|uniref:Magnesium transport protein CorA n=1 Tax=Nocardioides mangrovicus TaxID=2478913 RepID=A0A3L8NZV1_9ACTN|nr:magnesium/cobalt transporter CorA [Nocardioides mangrovicus]RLV48720.1 magnesium and cobalt transport protein CorA [Nocardioides mangrovicus]